MFQPFNDFEVPVAEIPPLFTTQEEYCAIAVPFTENADDTFNYSFQDMQQNDERYRTYFKRNLPYYVFGSGLQSLDALCIFRQNEDTLERIYSNRNFEDTVVNPNACNLIGMNYPIFANKINNYNTLNFKNRAIENNISSLNNQIRQIRDQNLKTIRSFIRFTDQQLCRIDLTRRTDAVGNLQTEVTNCVCPGLEVIEPPKDSNSQVPVTDAPVSDSSVTVPVTNAQMTASVTDAPARQP